MSRMNLIAVLTLALLSGCDAAPTRPPSRSAVFLNAQQDTVTPHGKIEPATVREAPDGDIIYKTSDGAEWKVSMETAADGQPRFGEPQRQTE